MDENADAMICFCTLKIQVTVQLHIEVLRHGDGFCTLNI